MKKRKEKRRKIRLKNGGKGLKNASVWITNSKIFQGKKNETQSGGGRNGLNLIRVISSNNFRGGGVCCRG